jgi:hypothetical protein
MLRITILAAAIHLLSACGGKPDVEETVSTAAEPEKTADSYIEYNGKRYELTAAGDCGARPDGTYLTWAVTLDADGEPDRDGAHLYAMREAHWSLIDFYSPDDDKIIRIYREGRERFSFEDGVLDFAGELGAGLAAMAKVRIVCPE